jgi:hypothetical protein
VKEDIMPRPKRKITNCPHTDQPYFALGRCVKCYRKFRKEPSQTVGITAAAKMKARKITACEHTDEAHYARGMCQNCYQKALKKGLLENVQRHMRIPAWVVVKGLEEGKSYYEIAKDNVTNVSNIIERCKVLGIHTSKIFTNAKDIKKMSRMRNLPNRIITVSKTYFEKLGINWEKELYYRLESNPETKRIEIQVMDKQEAKEAWETEKTKGMTRYGRKNPYADDGKA